MSKKRILTRATTYLGIVATTASIFVPSASMIVLADALSSSDTSINSTGFSENTETEESSSLTSETSSTGTTVSDKDDDLQSDFENQPPVSDSSSTNSTSSSTSESASSSASSTGNSSNIGSTGNSKPGSTNSSKDSSSSERNESESKEEKKKIDKNKEKGPVGPIVYSRNQSTAEFIEEIGEDARLIGQENGLYASVMIAQAILESGSGNSGLARKPNYNLFGIKGSYQGEAVEMATMEDDGEGGLFTITAKFRKYPSYKESLDDYATLMTGGTSGRSTFYQGAWKANTKDYIEATRFLTGRYATDTRYNDKLNGLIDTYNLTEYDQKKTVPETIKKSKETQLFIDSIAEDSKKIADKNDLYASVLIAEAVLKSSSGNNVLVEQNNLYQTKGQFKGKGKNLATFVEEDEGVKLVEVEYKDYPDIETAINDYVEELKKEDKVYKEHTQTKKDSFRKVTAYLTVANRDDHLYHKKLNAIINTYDLTKYDKEVVVKKKPVSEKKVSHTDKVTTINKLGKDMADTLSESLDKPNKYTVSKEDK